MPIEFIPTPSWAPKEPEKVPETNQVIPPTPEKSWVDTSRQLAATGVRVGTGILGSVVATVPGYGTLGGGVIGGLGEGAAELIEGSELSPARMGVEAGLTAVPGGKIFSAGRVLRSMLGGAGLAGVGIAGRQLAESEKEGFDKLEDLHFGMPEAANVALGAGLGAYFGRNRGGGDTPGGGGASTYHIVDGKRVSGGGDDLGPAPLIQKELRNSPAMPDPKSPAGLKFAVDRAKKGTSLTPGEHAGLSEDIAKNPKSAVATQLFAKEGVPHYQIDPNTGLASPVDSVVNKRLAEDAGESIRDKAAKQTEAELKKAQAAKDKEWKQEATNLNKRDEFLSDQDAERGKFLDDTKKAHVTDSKQQATNLNTQEKFGSGLAQDIEKQIEEEVARARVAQTGAGMEEKGRSVTQTFKSPIEGGVETAVIKLGPKDPEKGATIPSEMANRIFGVTPAATDDVAEAVEDVVSVGTKTAPPAGTTPLPKGVKRFYTNKAAAYAVAKNHDMNVVAHPDGTFEIIPFVPTGKPGTATDIAPDSAPTGSAIVNDAGNPVGDASTFAGPEIERRAATRPTGPAEDTRYELARQKVVAENEAAAIARATGKETAKPSENTTSSIIEPTETIIERGLETGKALGSRSPETEAIVQKTKSILIDHYIGALQNGSGKEVTEIEQQLRTYGLTDSNLADIIDAVRFKRPIPQFDSAPPVTPGKGGVSVEEPPVTPSKSPIEQVLEGNKPPEVSAQPTSGAIPAVEAPPTQSISQLAEEEKAAWDKYWDLKKRKAPKEEIRAAGQAAGEIKVRLAKAMETGKVEPPAVQPPVTPVVPENGPAFAPGYEDDLKDLEALDPATRARVIQQLIRNPEAGQAGIESMLSLVGGLGGAAYGGATAGENEDPLSRAITFGTLGAGAGYMAPMAVKALIDQASSSGDENMMMQAAQKAKDTIVMAAKLFPDIQRFNWLTNIKNLPNNIFVGPYGGAIMRSLEGLIAGEEWAKPALKSLLTTNVGGVTLPIPGGNFIKGFRRANQEMRADEYVDEAFGRGEVSDALEQAPGWIKELLSSTGRSMSVGDRASRNLLTDAGAPESVGRAATLTDEGEVPFIKALQGNKRGPGARSWLMNSAFPFVRTIANQLEGTFERFPVLGEFAESVKVKEGSAPTPGMMRFAQQSLGFGVLGTTFTLGLIAEPDPVATPLYLKTLSNFGGQYGMLAAGAFAAGQAAQAGDKSTVMTFINHIAYGTPLPSLAPLIENAKFGQKVIEGEAGLEDIPSGVLPSNVKDLITGKNIFTGE